MKLEEKLENLRIRAYRFDIPYNDNISSQTIMYTTISTEKIRQKYCEKC